jgi:hypothetical protein
MKCKIIEHNFSTRCKAVNSQRCSLKGEVFGMLLPADCHLDLSKRQSLFNSRRGVTSQKTESSAFEHLQSCAVSDNRLPPPNLHAVP